MRSLSEHLKNNIFKSIQHEETKGYSDEKNDTI
jgi:hypothetical protein